MRGIDSNIFIYAYDNNAGEKHVKALALLKKFYLGNVNGVVSAQTLGEFFTIATRKMNPPMPRDKAQSIVQDIVESPFFKIVNYNEHGILNAMHKTSSTRRFWDTLIATTLLENGADTIYTEDVDDFAGTGVRAINPLEVQHGNTA